MVGETDTLSDSGLWLVNRSYGTGGVGKWLDVVGCAPAAAGALHPRDKS